MTNGFTLIDSGRSTLVDARIASGRVRIAKDDLRQAVGWELKPEGLCRGSVCVPVSDPSLLGDGREIDLQALAGALGCPLALDTDERAAALGTPASDRAASLANLEAPDFRLPDFEGTLHSLSEYRGKKVLLIAYASW